MKAANRIPCRPATDEECQMIRALQGVRTSPIGPDASFLRQMRRCLDISIGNSEPLEITEGQAEYLRKVMFRYRYQLKPKKWGTPHGQQRPPLD
jgi:hypothetical protein